MLYTHTTPSAQQVHDTFCNILGYLLVKTTPEKKKEKKELDVMSLDRVTRAARRNRS